MTNYGGISFLAISALFSLPFLTVLIFLSFADFPFVHLVAVLRCHTVIVTMMIYVGTNFSRFSSLLLRFHKSGQIWFSVEPHASHAVANTPHGTCAAETRRTNQTRTCLSASALHFTLNSVKEKNDW